MTTKTIDELPSFLRDRIDDLIKMANNISDITRISIYWSDGLFPTVYEFRMWQTDEKDPMIKYGSIPSYVAVHTLELKWYLKPVSNTSHVESAWRITEID